MKIATTRHEDPATTGHEDIVYVNPFTTRYGDLPSPTPKEEHEMQVVEVSSSKSKKNRSKKIKKLREKIEQQEVLERVIKTKYEILSKNFAETSATL
jgi:hypothetical protein